MDSSIISDLIKKENELKILQNDYDKQLTIYNNSMESMDAPMDAIKQNALLEDKLLPLNEKQAEIKDYLKNNNVGEDIIGSYFNKDSSVFSGFKGTSESRIESLNNLLPDNLLKQYNNLKQQSLNDPQNESIKDEMRNIHKNWDEQASQLQNVLKSRGRYKGDDYVENPENLDEQISDLKETIKNTETEIEFTKNTISDMEGGEHSHGHDLTPEDEGYKGNKGTIGGAEYSGIEILEQILTGFKFLLLRLVTTKFPVAGIGISVLNRILPIEISDVAMNTLSLMMMTSSQKNRLRGGHRPDLRDSKHMTKRLVENPSIFPLLIIGLKTYFEYLGLGSQSVSFLQLAIKSVFGYIVGFQSNDKQWLTFVMDNFPKEISIEYKRHGDRIGEQDPNYELIVSSYRKELVKKYREIYEKDLYKDIEKLEGSTSSVGIVSMFKLLHTPAKLHELSSLFKSLESSMTDLGIGGLVGLIGVAYAELADKGELDNVQLLSNLKVVGIVKYVKQTDNPGAMSTVDTQIMLDMDKPADQRGTGSNLQGYTVVPKMNLETVAVYKNKMDDYQIVFRGTRTDIQSFLTKDLQRNVLNLAGSPELFNREPYAKNYRMADDFLQRIYMRNPRSVKAQGYSLGGIGALFLASKHNIQTNVYNPILGNNEQTIRLFKKIKEIGNNNIDIYYVPTDPISVNVPLYAGYGVRLNKKGKSKFHNAHSMKNFI